MADGSGGFRFPLHDLKSRLRADEITVDLFAGGGGASHAMETALARAVDIAINHNAWAVGLHSANHPFTRHLCQDVWEADPAKKIKTWCFGHTHERRDFFEWKIRFICNPRGYRGEKKWHGLGFQGIQDVDTQEEEISSAFGPVEPS